MPVHAPGPRLFNSIPFDYLANVGAHGGSRGSNIALNLTPFVDMMTILVTFLLMVFSATGDILTTEKGLELPSATSQHMLQKSIPIIKVGNGRISLNNSQIVSERQVSEGTAWQIPELESRLKALRKKFEKDFAAQPQYLKDRCKPESVANPIAGKWCGRGLAILQADKDTESVVITRVLRTAQSADYKNVMFAIQYSSGK